MNDEVQKVKGMFSVKTRFADVLIGQILLVLASAPLCYRDLMTLVCAVTVMFTVVSIVVARSSLISVL
jgi:hypothetical protein